MRLPAEQRWTVILALRVISDWPSARFAAERMLAEAGADGDPSARRLVMAAQVFLAETLARDPDQASDLARSEQLCADALSIARALAKELDTPEARRDVYVSLAMLGQIRTVNSDFDEAKQLFEEGLEIIAHLQQQTGAAELTRDRALCHIHLASVAEARGDTAGARAALAEARTAAEAFSRQQPISDAESIMAAVTEALAHLR